MSYQHLTQDSHQLPALLQQACDQAIDILRQIEQRPVQQPLLTIPAQTLPHTGLGAAAALTQFQQHFGTGFTGSAGPRYLGFVTGGTTPAALIGDWLTSTYDQNASDSSSQAANQLELQTIGMFRDLLRLPSNFHGRFVSGATISNLVGLAIGRQWWGLQYGVNVARQGLAGVPPLTILSGSPHSCIFKSLAILGIGRDQLRLVPTLPDREAVDVSALRHALEQLNGQPCIVVANAGVVNTVDFDDLQAIAALKQEFGFYLHIDAAFGGFAACSPRYAQLVAGWEHADSIAVDAHKWLNVPYDSAIQLSRHPELQVQVFQNSGAAYLSQPNNNDAFHLTPENSRRLRALPAWMSLMAYGAEGYRQIVEQNCDCAQHLATLISNSPHFDLLAPARMNVVTWTLKQPLATQPLIQQLLAHVSRSGVTFLTPTVYQQRPAIRAAFSNWRTQATDVALIWQALDAAAHGLTPLPATASQ